MDLHKPTQWLICVIAAISFAFDIYELLMLPLIVRPFLFRPNGWPLASRSVRTSSESSSEL